MSRWELVFASVRYYWRSHLGVLLGAALATMVLTGSLLVGDSVQGTLHRQALLRVGQVDAALIGGDHFFRSRLADEFGEKFAPVLSLRGSVTLPDGAARLNQAQVLGVDARFWRAAPQSAADLPAGEVALNQQAARQLGVQAGATVVVRVEKPGFFSRDAPLSGEENEVVAIRAKVARVLTDAEFGRFSLQASQVPPASIFVPLALLQERLAFAGHANVLLAPAPAPAGGAGGSLERAFTEHGTLEDLELQLRKVPATGGAELRSPRVFLDPQLIAAAPRGLQALTYLVNELRAGSRAVPYSMVTALEAPAAGFLPGNLGPEEIVINQWLADDLQLSVGGKVTLKYFVMGERRQLTEQSREFTVAAILPMTEPQLDGSWMPDFPGLSDKKSCRDWQPGFQMDTTRIRDQDEAYWQKYRGTPKGFVTLATGQQMWGNRWGAVTAVRYPPALKAAELTAALRAKITPQLAGLRVLPLREQALAATKAPVDFGELFVSFSFFLIVAAAVLTGLLFVFSIEQRNAEAGLLMAVGLRPRQVRWLFFTEGALLALLGALLGSLLAVVYTKLVLAALAGVWRGAVGAVDFQFAVSPATIPIGVFAGLLIAMLAMWLASRRQLRRGARELLAGGLAEEVAAPRTRSPLSAQDAVAPQKKFLPSKSRLLKRHLPAALAVVSLLGAGALLLLEPGAEGFFGAGSLLLIAGLALAWHWLRHVASAAAGVDSIAQLGIRNAARRRGRSIATISVLASGVFIVVAIDSFRHRPLREGDTTDPGTGGYALLGESALPIYEDLSSAKGREAYGLDEHLMAGVRIVPFRIHEGDDASCLNLNRALQPRLLGVNPEELREQKAFVRSAREDPWGSLQAAAANPGETHGVADGATLEWALQKKLGETVQYAGEQGRPFNVKLVASLQDSVMQGSIIIPEKDFVARFPSSGGYRFFLIGCPPERVQAVREHLSRQLSDRGLALSSSTQRLGEFQAVENTYLSIFQALGGLGLLLGSAGLAIVVARHVLERRQEFGLLEALGFQQRQLRRLILAEHGGLIVAALLVGAASALLAIWPNLARKSGDLPVRELASVLILLTLASFFWTWLATRVALRGSGVAALRTE